jgi:hypothetical protein
MNQKCPFCRVKIRFPPESGGPKLVCPHCQKEIIFGRSILNRVVNGIAWSLIIFTAFCFISACVLTTLSDISTGAQIRQWLHECVLCSLSFAILLAIPISRTKLFFAETKGQFYAELKGVMSAGYITAKGLMFLGSLVGCGVIVLIPFLYIEFKICENRTYHSYTPTYNSSVSEANKGYMTRQDDGLLTATAIKKGSGESLTKSEQDILDAAAAGKFGKPFGDRPDQDHDSPDPLK